ncbi:MAG: 2,3-bisphosphoglycerate-independent phosphoglycerate mutase [Pseudomonadota bacterium]
MPTPKPVVLCILDGWGISDTEVGNAPLLAKTPNFDAIMRGPTAKLLTHGRDAGLPTGQMGNSEVGHTNIGAGRVVAMDLGQIDLAIEDGSFADQGALQGFIATLKESGGTAHLMGVISDGGVHGHIAHIIATAEVLVDAGIPVVLHALTDGRDVAPSSALDFMDVLLADLPDAVEIGTVIGRYYAMDRDNRWERVETAFGAMVKAEGPTAADPREAIEDAYDDGKTDEFVPATVIEGYTGFAAEDGLFCLNFRSDRAREILEAIANPDFDGFARELPLLAARLGMVEYSDRHTTWYDTVFPKRSIPNTLGEWISKQGKTQFRLAETEKYPHVTFFLNGGEETPFEGEERFMPQSPKVATYDLQPEMSAGEVTAHFVGAIEKGYDLIVTNFANPDMVGHTGDLDAAIAACEAVDAGLGQVLAALTTAGGAMIVTADHGNCETMIDPATGGPHTAHTLNPVPVALVGGPAGAVLRDGRLADLAPTVLALMELPQPDEMTGESLITT